MHLVESNGKKAAFLREAVAGHSALPAAVHAVRIEEFAANMRRNASTSSPPARWRRLPKLLSAAYPLLKTGALGLFPKGQDVEAN